MQISPIRHVIWDWNGTLFDDATVCWEICSALVVEQGGSAPDFDRFRALFCIPVRTFWNELLGQEVPEEEFLIIGEDFHRRYVDRRQECTLQPDAKSVLEALKLAGISQSILSSHPQALLEKAVTICEIDQYFTAVSGHPAEGGGSKIPLGRHHIGALGLVPGETVLVGDTVHDHELANELGVRSILFSGGAQCPSRLTQTPAPVVNTLTEILGLLGVAR